MRLTADAFARLLKTQARKVRASAERGLEAGIEKNRAKMVRLTPKGTNQMRRAWVAGKRTLTNDAPYAGIVEAGARPHPVSDLGILRIADWAQRKLGLSREGAMDVAQSVAFKLRTRGQRPTYIVLNNLEKLAKQAGYQVRKEIVKLVGK